MKYFLDTEFIEGFHKPMFGRKRHFIDLISIGIVREDGKSYYAICRDYDPKDADKWVMDNVITPMYIQTVHGDQRNRYRTDNFHRFYGLSNDQIASDIISFVGDNPEFYAYYADYDWVLFCSLFGRMIDLPKGFPMYCRDPKQTLDGKISQSEIRSIGYDRAVQRLKEKKGYPQGDNSHNALEDARWNKQLYEFLQTFQP